MLFLTRGKDFLNIYFNLSVSANIGYLIVHGNFPNLYIWINPLPSSNTNSKRIIKNTNNIVTLLNIRFSKSQNESSFFILHIML